MSSQDKDKIIKPGDPEFDIDVPRPNPGRNTADTLSDALPGAPPPTGRPGDTTAAFETSHPEAPRSLVGPTPSPRGERGMQRERRVRRSQPVQEQVRHLGRQAVKSSTKARGQANRFFRRADDWIGRQVDQRPVGVVGAAFAAGYVLSAGLPRWATRNLARVALPLAATAWLVRMVTEMGESASHAEETGRESTWR